MNKMLRFSLLALAMGTFSLTLMSNWDGPESAAAGSPLEQGNTCAGGYCHGGTPNSGGGSISINAPQKYNAGKTYTITVQVNDESSSKFGFQAVVLDGSNRQAGTFKTGSNMETFMSRGATYIQHANASTFSTGTFEFEWTAPADANGDLTIYVAGNASNSNQKASGDNVYTTSSVMGFTTNIDAPDVNLDIFPNPSSEVLNINLDRQDLFDLSIVAMDGKLVLNNANVRGNQTLDVSNLEPGIYSVNIAGDDFRVQRKITIE